MRSSYSSWDQAQAPLIIDHDFGRNYGSDEFETAKFRGHPQSDKDGGVEEIPLVWGQEAMKFLSPIPFKSWKVHGIVFGLNKDGSRLAVSNSEKAIIFDVRSNEELFGLQHEDK